MPTAKLWITEVTFTGTGGEEAIVVVDHYADHAIDAKERAREVAREHLSFSEPREGNAEEYARYYGNEKAKRITDELSDLAIRAIEHVGTHNCHTRELYAKWLIHFYSEHGREPTAKEREAKAHYFDNGGED